MAAVWVNPPADLLAERSRLGLDRFDEMWDGELHMAPMPSGYHQQLGTRLIRALFDIVVEAGLEIIHETSFYDPEVPGHSSYRVPDLTIFDPHLLSQRGVEGGAALVVEIRSPDDESFLKLPYYERLGVGEVLIIDQLDHRLFHWTNGAGGLTPTATGTVDQLDLGCIPIRLRYDGPLLVVEHVEPDGSLTTLLRT